MIIHLSPTKRNSRLRRLSVLISFDLHVHGNVPPLVAYQLDSLETNHFFIAFVVFLDLYLGMRYVEPPPVLWVICVVAWSIVYFSSF